MPGLAEKREAGGVASGRLLEQLRGIGRKCAFYNGFAVSCPRQVICQHVNAEFMV